MQENKQEKSPIKQKILLYLDFIGVSQYDFYKKTGVTRGVLGQNNGISEDNLSRFLAHYPEVNPVWLLTGRGEMLIGASPSASAPQKADNPFLYNMYKEERAKSDAQAEQIGVLKQTIRQLEEKIEGLQQNPDQEIQSEGKRASAGSTRTHKRGVAGSEDARFAE